MMKLFKAVSKLDMKLIQIKRDLQIYAIRGSYFFALFLMSFNLSAEILSDVGVQGLSFISSDYENTRNSQFGFIEVSLRSYKAKDDIFKINLQGSYAVGNPVLSYLNLKEIYFTYKVGSESEINSSHPADLVVKEINLEAPPEMQVHIGRKLNVWSDVDQRWNLGFFQPQFRWNPLDVESQGLFGFFLDKKTKNWSFGFFGTPFFIPDQGPNYELKNGKFQASSPWFTPPPQNVYFQSVLLPIDYNITKPNVSDVVMQPSFAAQFRYGEDVGSYINLSGAYKPSHQFAFGYSGVLVTDHVKVDILPKTYYENLFNFDLGYREHWGQIDLSILYFKPQNPEFDPQYNYPVLEQAVVFGPHVKYDFQYFEGELSALLTSGGEITEKGPDASGSRLPLTSKLLYKNAYQVQINKKFQYKDTFKYMTSVSWREAERAQLRLLKWKNVFDVRGPWKFTMDLILVDTDDEYSYVSTYKNLDQIWLGAVYDF